MLLMVEKDIRGGICHSIVVYNRVFWHTLGRAQNNNYKNQIKKMIPLKLTKILIMLIFKVLSNN